MKNILLFGAGKSATVLIDYLKKITVQFNWKATVVDGNLELVESKTNNHTHLQAASINIEDTDARQTLIANADIVISLMPPNLHFLIAKDCLQFSKNLLTASYIDEQTKTLAQAAKEKGILFLYEMGLDPGIDHMSAMQIIDDIKNKGGKISSFISHCGGLVAPESDDNPWHYKISWNPRNVVMAGKAGAIFLKNAKVENVVYENLFTANNIVTLKNNESFAYYSNRDSLSYIDTYNLQGINTFIRTTLRHPNFSLGWNVVVDLHLTNEEKVYETNGLTLSKFFENHLQKNGLTDKFNTIINQNETIKRQFNFLGLNDNKTQLNLGLASAADVLQFILENKLVLSSTDKDMIVMLHEFKYELEEKKYSLNSLLRVIGTSNTHTAMAKTVGLPLGIAAQLILSGEIKETGLHIPMLPSIYKPVLNILKENDIEFDEYLTN